jgi:hypothetical protein
VKLLNTTRDFLASKSIAGQRVHSFEDELQGKISVEFELIFPTPNRTNKALSGAWRAAFNIHIVSMVVV